jgi:hypothetical protein
MTNLKLEHANYLNSKIKEVKEMIHNTKTAKCESIYFTHGNGFQKETVCLDDSIILKARALLITEHQLKLDELLIEFNTL